MTIGQRMREIRHKRNKTLEDVATAVGSTISSISKYEKDMVKSIPQDKLKAIADYLDVTLPYLMGIENTELRSSYPLSISEYFIIDDFRRLNEADQKTVTLLIHRLLEVEKLSDQEREHQASNSPFQQLSF